MPFPSLFKLPAPARLLPDDNIQKSFAIVYDVKEPECAALPSGDEWPNGFGGGPTMSVGRNQMIFTAASQGVVS